MAVLLAGLPVTVPATTVNRLCGCRSMPPCIGFAADRDRRRRGRARRRRGVDDPRAVGAAEAGARRSRRATSTRGLDDARAGGWSTSGCRRSGPSRWASATSSWPSSSASRASARTSSRPRSHQLADAGLGRAGFYDDLVVPVPGVEPRTGRVHPRRHDAGEAGRRSSRSFRPDGTITAGNASPLNDGAAAVLLGSEAAPTRIGLDPLARVAGRGVAALEPQLFGFAPVEAAERALRPRRDRLGRRRRRRAQRGVRRAVARLRRRLEDRPGDRQRQGRRDRDRAPARRLRRPHPRHAAQRLRESRRALGRGRDLHRRRPGARRGAREHLRSRS